MTTAERIEILEEIREKCEEMARLIRSLGDQRIAAYHMADFEGREHGWLGQNFLVDQVNEQLNDLAFGDDEVAA